LTAFAPGASTVIGAFRLWQAWVSTSEPYFVAFQNASYIGRICSQGGKGRFSSLVISFHR
jgi:hypothetical protein